MHQNRPRGAGAVFSLPTKCGVAAAQALVSRASDAKNNQRQSVLRIGHNAFDEGVTYAHGPLPAQLDRPAPTREVAQIGAALRRSFAHELISAVATMPKQQLG